MDPVKHCEFWGKCCNYSWAVAGLKDNLWHTSILMDSLQPSIKNQIPCLFITISTNVTLCWACVYIPVIYDQNYNSIIDYYNLSLITESTVILWHGLITSGIYAYWSLFLIILALYEVSMANYAYCTIFGDCAEVSALPYLCRLGF